MTSKVKTLLKVGIPLVIVIQLISITFLLARLNRDKAAYDEKYVTMRKEWRSQE